MVGSDEFPFGALYLFSGGAVSFRERTLPSYLGIKLSCYKDPYQPISIIECRKGFEHCSIVFFWMPAKERKHTSTWILLISWILSARNHQGRLKKKNTFLKCFKTIGQKQVSSPSFCPQSETVVLHRGSSIIFGDMEIPFTAASHKLLKEGGLGIGIRNHGLE